MLRTNGLFLLIIDFQSGVFVMAVRDVFRSLAYNPARKGKAVRVPDHHGNFSSRIVDPSLMP